MLLHLGCTRQSSVKRSGLIQTRVSVQRLLRTRHPHHGRLHARRTLGRQLGFRSHSEPETLKPSTPTTPLARVAAVAP